jgi:hypothetical protein
MGGMLCFFIVGVGFTFFTLQIETSFFIMNIQGTLTIQLDQTSITIPYIIHSGIEGETFQSFVSNILPIRTNLSPGFQVCVCNGWSGGDCSIRMFIFSVFFMRITD